jgi:S-formylglutathione hydrolase FrmB
MKAAVGILMFLISCILLPFNVQVERIPSAVMGKTFNATVITPQNYGKTSKKYPVVYILHGWLNDYDSVNYYTEIGKLSDEYDFIIVMPDGNLNKWYFDSREDSSLKFGTYVGKEVPEYTDKKYRTIKKRSARAITGYSMGGFGAFNAVFNYPETFGSIGSMSGAVDITGYETKWNLRKIFGNYGENKELWESTAVKNNLEKFQNKKFNIIISCGSEDFFIDINRELHEKMVSAGIKHAYFERSGKHNWDYWREEIKFQLLFFKNSLK